VVTVALVVGAAVAAGPWQRAQVAAAAAYPGPYAPHPRLPVGAAETATAVLLGCLVLSGAHRLTGPQWAAAAAELAAFAWLGVVAVPLAAVDAAVFRLPDRLTALAYAGTLAPLTLAALAAQRHDDLLRAVLGGLAMSAFYLLLFLINPEGTGLGDVKLGAALGTALGWLGWIPLVAGAFLAYLGAALYGLALMAARRARRTSEIPFGPFMLLGAFAVIMTGAP